MAGASLVVVVNSITAGPNAQRNIPVEDKLLIYTARPSSRTTFNMHKDYCGTEFTCHTLNMRQFAD